MVYKVVYSSLYDKWQVKRKTVVGWVVLEEFREKDDAVSCMNRLKSFRKSKRA